MVKKHFLLLIILISASVKAQFAPLSETSEISVLTIGPGMELYDKFGHNAFRIQDTLNGVDVVFNYGAYDFNTPNFYTKFAQGKLLYEIDAEYYNSFYSRYAAQNRWIKQQTLNLTTTEKRELSDYLWNNLKPKNKKYKYDFFFDNCATKIRDVVWKILGDKLEFKQEYTKHSFTFRQLIQQNLHANTWGSLGIDIALGAIIDRKAKPIEYQFLPNYVYKGAENAIIHRTSGDEKLVKSSSMLFKNTKMPYKNNFFLSPFFILGIIGLLIVLVTFRDYKRKTRSRFLDVLIFFFTGLIGVFILLLWFATDHTATANNYNLLWAFPISLLFLFSIGKRNVSPKLKRYVLLLILLLSLLTIHWITGVQIFAITMLPLLIALTIRYVYLMHFIGKQD